MQRKFKYTILSIVVIASIVGSSLIIFSNKSTKIEESYVASPNCFENTYILPQPNSGSNKYDAGTSFTIRIYYKNDNNPAFIDDLVAKFNITCYDQYKYGPGGPVYPYVTTNVTINPMADYWLYGGHNGTSDVKFTIAQDAPSALLYIDFIQMTVNGTSVHGEYWSADTPTIL